MAFEGFISAAHYARSTFEELAETARKGAKDIGQKGMDFGEQNIASSFEFAQKLVGAKDVNEMLELQAEYIKMQMQVLAEQAKELGESTLKRMHAQKMFPLPQERENCCRPTRLLALAIVLEPQVHESGGQDFDPMSWGR